MQIHHLMLRSHLEQNSNGFYGTSQLISFKRKNTRKVCFFFKQKTIQLKLYKRLKHMHSIGIDAYNIDWLAE